MANRYRKSSDNIPSAGEGRRWRSSSSQSAPVNAVEPVRIDVNKRAVALGIDVVAGYLLGIIVALIPFMGTFFSMQLTMALYLVCRDYLFAGRGIGKNVMGLQVVDIQTGAPATLLQSVERNIILIAPVVVLQVVSKLLGFVPVPWLNSAVVNVINILGMIYCLIVIPMEAYRVYSREDGLRLGDEIAGTAEIEAPMDFSQMFPRQ